MDHGMEEMEESPFILFCISFARVDEETRCLSVS